MTCAGFKENVAALVLGSLDADERRAVEAHLDEPIAHDGCAAALAEAYETVALLGAALPPLEPGPGVWQAIEREIGVDGSEVRVVGESGSSAETATVAVASGVGNGSPVRSVGSAGSQGSARGAFATRPASASRGRRSPRREIVAWGLAAAAVVLAFVLGGELLVSQRRIADAERALTVAAASDRDKQICLRELATARVSLREREAALSLLGASGTQLVQLAAQGDEPYRASALLNPGENSAMILTTALKPVPGKDFQLWLIRGEEKVSAGILRTDASGATLARLSEQVLAGGRPDAFAVTVEPPGGMPQPTGPIILLGKVPAAA